MRSSRLDVVLVNDGVRALIQTHVLLDGLARVKLEAANRFDLIECTIVEVYNVGLPGPAFWAAQFFKEKVAEITIWRPIGQTKFCLSAGGVGLQ